MITLAHLRALLERALTHAENPTVVRLTDRTVEGVARAYLPRRMSLSFGYQSLSAGQFFDDSARFYTLDLTDPGTAHALLVALALALGLDPGAGGMGVQWTRLELDDQHCWAIHGQPNRDDYMDACFAHRQTRCLSRPLRDWVIPTVAAEPDPLKALALAVLHVLESA